MESIKQVVWLSSQAKNTERAWSTNNNNILVCTQL